ncbi:MAG: class I SAM-dependent methyltransferase [Chroococcidiopsidaceae cyanobacterium CP_BM_RX_35]|nr:class I SAM-dependent methyltransferase [Chroococcidiopsidaceae cyanobacterium CP_BM_RX_35]
MNRENTDDFSTTGQAKETFEEAPVQSWQWLRPLLPKRLQPYFRGLRKRLELRKLSLEEPFRSLYPFTQVSQGRLDNLAQLAVRIEEEGVEGDIVECGVLDGGSAALMAYATRECPNRKIHLFDAWSGLPPSGAKDGESGKKWSGQVVGSPHRVRAIMRKMRIPSERVVFHEGWFSDTFPKAKIQQIALLHIDADFYEPVKLCLETWSPHLSKGGYIQLDDYSVFKGCRHAVDEFLAQNPGMALTTYKDAYYIRIS